MATAAEEITISDVGPNARVVLPYLEKGGVVVIRGANDRGKTEALKAVKRLIGADEKLSRREGVTGRGIVEGFGLTLTVGASTRQAGECEVTSLEGHLDLSDLIEPREKSAEAADRKRIKAILSISGAKADPDLFSGLVGGRGALERFCEPESLKADDLVDMAARIKRDLERAARTEEAQAQHAEGSADAAKKATEGIDASAPCDSAELDAAYRRAVQGHSQLRSMRVAAVQAAQRQEAAREKIRRLKSLYKGMSAEEAEQAVSARREERSEADKIVVAAKAALTRAEATAAEAEQRYLRASEAWEAAIDYEQAIKGASAIVEEAVAVQDPGQEAVEAAAAAVEQARVAVEHGALVRKAQEQLAAVADFKEDAKAHRQEADRLRIAAHGTDAVLSEAVRCREIAVKDGRLVTVKKDGREVFFGDRSAGYRAAVAIDIALERIRATNGDRRAVLVLNQNVWEGLDFANRQEVLRHARERRVCIYTAECTRAAGESGEVTATVFD